MERVLFAGSAGDLIHTLIERSVSIVVAVKEARRWSGTATR